MIPESTLTHQSRKLLIKTPMAGNEGVEISAPSFGIKTPMMVLEEQDDDDKNQIINAGKMIVERLSCRFGPAKNVRHGDFIERLLFRNRDKRFRKNDLHITRIGFHGNTLRTTCRYHPKARIREQSTSMDAKLRLMTNPSIPAAASSCPNCLMGLMHSSAGGIAGIPFRRTRIVDRPPLKRLLHVAGEPHAFRSHTIKHPIAKTSNIQPKKR